MSHISINAILDADRIEKEKAGSDFENDSKKLTKLYEGRGRQTVRDFIGGIGMGDPENQRPVAPNITARLIDSVAVLYASPATRLLKRNGVVLDDDHPDSVALAEATQRMELDAVMARADAYRQLLRQVIVMFAESDAHGSVVSRLFEPHNYARKVSPWAADLLEEDEAIAFRLAFGSNDGDEHPDDLWEVWMHEDNGDWRVWRVNGDGDRTGHQPFGDDGTSPFGLLPAVQLTDAVPMGRAYLPIPENRLDALLMASAIASDAAFIAKMEAHSLIVFHTEDTKGVQKIADEAGPNKAAVMAQDDRIEVHGHQSQLDSVNKTGDRMLSLLAISEGLPPDAMSSTRVIPNSAQAFKIANLDQQTRRQKQLQPTINTEARAYVKYARVWNIAIADAAQGRHALAEDVELAVSFAQSWVPVDRGEHQEVAFKDIAASVLSVIDYRAEAYAETRPQAIASLERARVDNEQFEPKQNPASMTAGPNAAGVDSTSVPGEFRPDVSSSVEGASTTAAVQSRLAGSNGVSQVPDIPEE